MIHDPDNRPTILACCVPTSCNRASDAIEVTDAASGREALELVELTAFDLFLCGEDVHDIPVRTLVRQLRERSPSQKWAMVGARLSDADEIFARAEGAVAVLDTMPELTSLISLVVTLRRRWGNPRFTKPRPAANRESTVPKSASTLRRTWRRRRGVQKS